MAALSFHIYPPSGLPELNYNFRHREGVNGALSVLFRLLSGTKGAGDLLGLVSGVSRVYSKIFSKSPEGASHISSAVSQAKTALLIPSFFRYVNSCAVALAGGKYFTGVHSALEACYSGSLVVSLFVVDKIASSVFVGVGGVFKIFVSGIHCYKQCKEFSKVRLDYSHLVGRADSEGNAGLSAKWNATLLKIGRYAMAFFSGILMGSVFLFQVAFAKDLLLLAVLASSISLIFSIAADWVMESSKYVEVSPNSARSPLVTPYIPG